MPSSFPQLMSKETISPFGPELSGDLEQQVSDNTETPEKETNLKRVGTLSLNQVQWESVKQNVFVGNTFEVT